MSFPTQDNYMQQDASRLYDKIYQIRRATGRVSALIEKGEIPSGQGYNYSTVIQKRSVDTGGNDWQDVLQENGTSNNCVTQPNQLDPASTTIAWNAQERAIRSNKICYEDLYRAYDGREQLSAQQDNFAANTVTVWEDKDNLSFFTNSGHKMIANASLTENVNSTQMPLTTPTTRGIQGILDILYERLMNDGAGEESYAKAGGKPLITAIMSMQQNRNIIKEDASVRQDFQFAQMGEDSGAWLLQSWGIDREYGGYMHLVNLLQPRYDWIGNVWVKRDYYVNVPTTLGNEAVVNPAYTNAAYEDIYLWHPQVVKRNMPRPMMGFGAGTQFDPVKWNGAIMWVNVKNTDTNSTEYNPFGNVGRYYAALQAGYQPVKINYGYSLRVQRCSKFTASSCY